MNHQQAIMVWFLLSLAIIWLIGLTANILLDVRQKRDEPIMNLDDIKGQVKHLGELITGLRRDLEQLANSTSQYDFMVKKLTDKQQVIDRKFQGWLEGNGENR